VIAVPEAAAGLEPLTASVFPLSAVAQAQNRGSITVISTQKGVEPKLPAIILPFSASLLMSYLQIS